jgi:LmbE family N-acetylglucosaminyl deacetylase
MEQQKCIMAIGGHIGDAELTSGGVLATLALQGWKIVTVATTGGEKGNPPGMTVAQYRVQKEREAREFAQMLGGESVVFPYSDGELPDNEEVRWMLADLIRRYKPRALLTHWANSMHKDHALTHRIVRDAQFYAGLPAFERELPAHFAAGPYYAENWEDSEGFVPYTYMKVTPEGFALWQKAIEKHWFTTHSTSFRYKEYYEHLMAMRGCLARSAYAQAFAVDEYTKKQVIDTF